jgi:FMN phosphatase YigB (HAD superfamily)
MTKGYIFDYGGTLDTGGQHWGRLLGRLYQQVGVPVSEEQFREAYVHAERTLGKTPIIQSSYSFRETLDAKLRIELEYLVDMLQQPSLMQYHDSLVNAAWNVAAEYTAKSAVVLRQLALQYSLVLVSNFYGNIHVILSEFGLADCFTSVIESAVVGIRKPDPAIFQLGVDALHLPAHEVTVVGDSISKDIMPARKIGCQTVWLRSEGWTDDPVDESVPDSIITRLDELLA